MGTDCDDIKKKYNRSTLPDDWENLPTGITTEDIFKCTGLCGPGKYIKLDFALDIDNGTPEASCGVCDTEDMDDDSRCSDKYWYSSQRSANVLKTNYTWPDKEVWKEFNSEDISIKDDEGRELDIVDENLSEYSIYSDNTNLFSFH